MQRHGALYSMVGLLVLATCSQPGEENARLQREREEQKRHPSWYGKDGFGNPVKKRSERLQVKVAAGKPREDGSQAITLTLTIDEGWFVYANPVGLPDLESHQLTVAVQAKVKLVKVSIDYPAGKEIKDNVVGNHRVYQGKVVVPVTVRRARGDEKPIKITVRFYPLDNRTCGGMESKTVTVPLSSSSKS